MGSDQKGEMFYKSINEYYPTIKLAYCLRRNDMSVELLIRKILAECLYFASCVAKINNARQSGTSKEDVMYLATALFNKLELSSVSDDCGPPVKFTSCWCIVKDHHKFDVLLKQSNPPKPVTIRAIENVNEKDGDKEEEI